MFGIRASWMSLFSSSISSSRVYYNFLMFSIGEARRKPSWIQEAATTRISSFYSLAYLL